MIKNERLNYVLEILNRNNDIDSDERMMANAIAYKLLGRELNENNDDINKNDMNVLPKFDYSQLVYNAAQMNMLWDTNYYQINATGGIVKKLIKKIIKKMVSPVIAPLFEKQREFNAVTVRAMNCLKDNTRSIEKVAEIVNHHNSHLNDLLEKDVNDKGYMTIDYEKFQQRFRKLDDVKKSFQPYLELLKCKNNIIDLGCGRGEVLELLKENGIHAIGVEQYIPFVEMCRKKGLIVKESDIIDFLDTLNSDSVDCFFASQVVEHLNIADFIALCEQTYDKLMVGGYFIAETPNPLCLSIYRDSFYIDPTHNRPIHPEFFKFLLEEIGFKHVDVIYTEASKIPYRLPLLDGSNINNLEEFNDGINCITDMLFGSRDYAVIATK